MRSGYDMDFDPMTGVLWDTENGAPFVDEINWLILALTVGGKSHKEWCHRLQPDRPCDVQLRESLQQSRVYLTEPVDPTALEFSLQVHLKSMRTICL